MFLAGHPSQGCFGPQSHCAPCYFFNQASFYPSDFSFSGSSDETFLNGGSVVFMTIPNEANYQRVIGAGAITSCFPCELRAIIEALDLYDILHILEKAKCLFIFCDSKVALQAILNGGSWITEGICIRLFMVQELDKVFFLRCLPLHVDNTDANAVTNFKLREKSIPIYHQICNISGGSLIAKTIARLRSGHHKGMKFDRDGRKTYRNCDNCLDADLTLADIFDCPAIFAALQEIGVLFSLTNLYGDNIKRIARTVIWAHGTV
ncbi:RNase H domain-containing protein [Trichonephila clavipes]|nr:RNase H domain-containing protein [Trichonephila clavipes]